MVTVSGYAASFDFPTTTNAYQKQHDGGYHDSYAVQMPMTMPGTRRYGTATASCLGLPTSFVLAEPKAGSMTFGFACTKAPASAAGFLALAAADFPTGLPVLGITLWLNPVPVLLVFPVASDASGQCRVPTPLPANTQGVRFYFQLVWQNIATCSGAGSFAASDALDVTIR